MKERWGIGLIVASAGMLGLMILALAVIEVLLAGGVPEAEVPAAAWATHLQRAEEALDRDDPFGGARHWREAYTAARRSRQWEAMVEVGDAARRLGRYGVFAEDREARAREAYLAALFRARHEGSLDGVLRVAGAFEALGDRDVVEQSIKIAETLARDPASATRVRAFADRWSTRLIDAERRGGPH